MLKKIIISNRQPAVKFRDTGGTAGAKFKSTGAPAEKKSEKIALLNI